MCSLPEKKSWNLTYSLQSLMHTKNKQTRKSLRKKSDVAIPQTNCSLFESSQDISIRQEKRCFSIEAPIWQKLQMASAIPISRDWIVFSKKEVTTLVLVFWQSYYIKDSLRIEKSGLAFNLQFWKNKHDSINEIRHYLFQWSHFVTSSYIRKQRECNYHTEHTLSWKDSYYICDSTKINILNIIRITITI